MHRFWGAVINPVLNLAAPRRVVEIGAATGQNTRKLARWCRTHGARLEIVDPKPGFDPAEIEAEYPATVKVHIALSLDVLADLMPADIVLIDGDHNWYTVFNEIRTLYGDGATIAEDAPIVICHDTAWPYARRDLYYDIDTIPPEGRQPARIGALSPYRKDIVGEGLNAVLCHAVNEGGPRNGVRTAIEDALEGRRDQVRVLWLDMLAGLTVIVPNARLAAAPALGDLLDQLTPSAALKGLIALTERERNDGAIAQQKLALLSGNIAFGETDLPASRPFSSVVPNAVWRDIQQGLGTQRYKGRALLLNPFDLANYQSLLGTLKPGTVFEIGCHEGGRALWMADMLSALGLDSRIISVDVAPPTFDDPRIVPVAGNALALGAVLDDRTMQDAPGPFLVIEDSAHTFDASLAVLEFFDRYLRPGDYIVVEDAVAGLLLDDAVPAASGQAVAAFLARRAADYEIDAAICDRFGYNTTGNLNGWLRRTGRR